MCAALGAKSAGRQDTNYDARGRVNRKLCDAAHKSSSTFVIVGFFVFVIVVATVVFVVTAVFVVVVIAIEEVQTRLSLAANSLRSRGVLHRSARSAVYRRWIFYTKYSYVQRFIEISKISTPPKRSKSTHLRTFSRVRKRSSPYTFITKQHKLNKIHFTARCQVHT